MWLIKLNEYIPPNPAVYEIKYSDVKGTEDKLEDGTTYTEQIRGGVPEIKVGWTNLTQDEVEKITEEVNNDIVTVQYFFGTVHTATMTKSDRDLKLKSIDSSGAYYWDLSFTLKG